MEEIREEVLEILEELHPDVDYEREQALIDDKILDSFDIVSLISEIKDAFDVTISADKIVPENFNSLDAICTLVQELSEED
ncbi:MAG: acyl carrier protein [Lachnospiraceae bacterium]